MAAPETPAERRARWLSVGISADATPTRRPRSATVNEKERVLSRDLDAYKRIVEAGAQPRQIDGCAALEKACDSKVEIEHQLRMTPRVRKHFEGDDA